MAEKGAVSSMRIALPGKWWSRASRPGMRSAWQGPGILLEDSSIDRQRLGTIVFNNAAEQQKLNRIIHPRVARNGGAHRPIRQSCSGACWFMTCPCLLKRACVPLTWWCWFAPGRKYSCSACSTGQPFREKALARRPQMPLKRKNTPTPSLITAAPRRYPNQVDRLWHHIA